MKLSRLLSVSLLAAVGLASCIGTENDVPASAAQTLTITSLINVNDYASVHGYIASEFERYLLCYNRGGLLMDELKYSGSSSIKFPAATYAVALRYDIYGKPRNITATEDALVACLTFERVSLSDISDGVLQANADNLNFASLMCDYGYSTAETKQKWNFFDEQSGIFCRIKLL